MTTEIILNVTREGLDELTWEQWEAIDDPKKMTYGAAREIISMFVEGVPQEEAKSLLGKLKTSQMRAIFEQFAEGVKKLQEVNPQTGGTS